jgi:hypothetical protein
MRKGTRSTSEKGRNEAPSVKTTVGGNRTFNFTSNFSVSSIATSGNTGSQTVAPESAPRNRPHSLTLDEAFCHEPPSGGRTGTC